MFSTRVLITTYHQAFLVRGGGEYEIISVADSLKRKGAVADIYSPYTRSLDNYDVVLHFSVHGGGLDLLREIKQAGKPVVLWPNLWVLAPDEAPLEVVNEHIRLADAVVFKSLSEKEQFCRLFALPDEKVHVITSGVDPSYTRPAPPDLFHSLYNIDRYAIWFGVIEPNKNQLAAVRVLRELDIPLVLVGKFRDAHYFDACRQAAGDNTLFIDGLPQKSEIVRAALRESLFYMEISHEPPGLSAIEAGLSGCRLLLSDSDWSREHFAEQAVYVDPRNEDSIASAVHEVLARPHDPAALMSRLNKHCLPDAILPLMDILAKSAQ